MNMKFTTRFTKSFPCKVPLMGAPMADVSGAELAVETCRAGALGFIAGGHLNSKEALHKLECEIDKFQHLCDGKYPLSIGFIGHSTFGSEEGWNMFENLLEDHQPQVVQIFAPAISYTTSKKRHTDVVKLAHSYGCKVIAQVGSLEDGIQAFESGVDCIIAQGIEAGGHGLRRELGTEMVRLVSQLVKHNKERTKQIPILAAGGITDGKDLASVIALGADGAVLGTRLWASNEAIGPASFKKALVAAKSADDVIRTRVFDIIGNRYRSAKWPKPYDSSGVLKNKITEDWDKNILGLEKLVASPEGSNFVDKIKRAAGKNDLSSACIYSGKGVAKIDAIEPAYDIITRIAAEARAELEKVSILPTNESSSSSSSSL